MEIAGFGVEEWLNVWEKKGDLRYCPEYDFINDNAGDLGPRWQEWPDLL